MIDRENYRILVIFRADLPEMIRAKGEVQFGHAVEGALLEAQHHAPGSLADYLTTNRAKINMEVDDLPALLKAVERAKRRGLPHFLVTDAAHTVFEKPTITCAGFGPMSKTDVNFVSRGARMRR